MSTQRICDDCGKTTTLENTIRLWTYPGKFPLANKDFCLLCFAKHWKPISKKFSLSNRSQPI